LLTITQGVDEFLDCFFDQLKSLLPHHFVSKEQSKQFKKLKEDLQEGEVLVVCDFAENYTCIIQDSVQSYYWDTTQVTLHPFVAYYKSDGELKCVNFVIVSDHMKHDISAVYTFQCKLIAFLKEFLPNLKKVIYFSDGAAQQYKNRKNVMNINCHLSDFGIIAEWHYFGTSHGKGPCDANAGTLKRNAYLASLRKTLIRNAFEFYTWAKENICGINVAFVQSDEVLQQQDKLRERFESALTIPDIRSQHIVISVSEGEVMTKRFSASTEGHLWPVKLIRKVPNFADIEPEMFLTILSGKKLYLAQVQFTDPETQEIFVNSFKRIGTSYKWRSESSEQIVEVQEIVVLVEKPRLENGIYLLSDHDLIRIKWQTQSMKRK
jgi:hypothetical protein